MRKFLISATLLASTLAIAAPAAAQWTLSYGNQYGDQYGNQYGGQYGNQYGYNNNSQTRYLAARVNRLEQQINVLDRRNILSEREAGQLRYQANIIEQQLRQASYNGLNGYERRNIEIRIARLEQNIRYQANDGNRYGNNGSYGYQDRDRDGRNDNREHSQWHNEHEGNDEDD